MDVITRILPILAIALIVASTGLVYSEIYGAKKFCESRGLRYSLQFFPRVKHLCNGTEIVHYTDGWNFNYSLEINLTKYLENGRE